MKSPLHSENRYLNTPEKESIWNLNVNTIGFESISDHSFYPASGHPQGYSFNFDRGRVLHEFQVVYITRGSGKFASDHCQLCDIGEGSVFFFIPGRMAYLSA